MRSSINSIFVLFLACSLIAAQTAATAKPADKPAARPADKLAPAATVLPSEAIVDAFLQQAFGYEAQVSWKISSIKPAPVPGNCPRAISSAPSRRQRNAASGRVPSSAAIWARLRSAASRPRIASPEPARTRHHPAAQSTAAIKQIPAANSITFERPLARHAQFAVDRAAIA